MSKGLTWFTFGIAATALAGTAAVGLQSISKKPEQLPIPNFAEVEKTAQDASRTSKEAAQKAEEADRKAAEAQKSSNETAANVASALDRLNTGLEAVTQKTEDAAKQAHTHEKQIVFEETYKPQIDCENQLRYAKAAGLLNAIYNREAKHGRAALWGPDFEVARAYFAKKLDADNNDKLSDGEVENAINANKGLEIVINVDGNTKFSVTRSPKFNSEEDKRAYLQLRQKVEASGKVSDIEWLYRVVSPYMNQEGFVTEDTIKKLEDLMRLR